MQRRLKYSGKKKDHDDDDEEEEPEEIPDPDRKLPWWDVFIIGHRNMTYLCFEILMCALCIVSSYFYASMMGFRYTFEEENRQKVMTTMLVFEAFFVVQFLLQFIREYKEDGFPPERDIAKIAIHYMTKGSFAVDLVCLLPLGILKMKRNREFLFFIIKMLRLVKGFELFNV